MCFKITIYPSYWGRGEIFNFFVVGLAGGGENLKF